MRKLINSNIPHKGENKGGGGQIAKKPEENKRKKGIAVSQI